MGTILITSVFVVFSVGVGVQGLISAPQSSWGPRGIGLAIVAVMSLIAQIIPDPAVTTIVLLIYGPVALIAYLVFMWWWRKRKDVRGQTKFQ